MLVVDDSTIIRKKITQVLRQNPEIQEIATAGNGTQALECFATLCPDIVTLDITMPEMDGLSCLRIMMDQNPECMVLIISALNDVETGLKALKLGAKGYINKPFRNGELLREISRMGNPG